MPSRMGHGELLGLVLGMALLNWIVVRSPPRISVSQPNWEGGPLQLILEFQNEIRSLELRPFSQLPECTRAVFFS